MANVKTTGRKERDQISHLMKLCHQGKCDMIEEYLSDYPHFLNARDTNGMVMTAPIHVCCDVGHYHCVKSLLVMNADIQVVDMKGRTPFHLSCMRGHYKITKLLKTKGGSVTKQDFGGNTPLHLVLNSPECSYSMVKFLLESGSDPCQVDNYAETPHSIVEKQYTANPSEANMRLLKIIEKYLPVIVDDDQLLKDTTTFSIGLGVAIGMIMKKERHKQKVRDLKRERKIQRELEILEEKRDKPEEVRRRMFEHMALMKTRRDFRVKKMNYVFPEESDLSSLPISLSKVSGQADATEEPETEPKKTHEANGRRITKYM